MFINFQKSIVKITHVDIKAEYINNFNYCTRFVIKGAHSHILTKNNLHKNIHNINL